MPLKPGDVLHGQFQILGLLGRGGFGYVYRARDTHLGEDVAIKELIPGLVGDEAMLKRFLAEAKATMRLRHDRIVATHHVFPERDNDYIVMDYMPGGSLEDRLRQGPLGVEASVRIATEVCEALAYAHSHGVVHCDLKPANILFGADGGARLADFGIAHVSDQMLSRSWQTPQGFVAGTLPYMSPDQVDGVRDNPRIDLYALGAVLYRMVTGRTYLDFDQTDTPRAQVENVNRICGQQPLPPSTHNRRVPAWLDAAILRALAKRPEERYAGAGEMRAALLAGERVAAPAAPPAEPQAALVPHQRSAAAATGRRALPRMFWPLVGGAAAVVVILAVALAVSLAGGRDGRETALPTQGPSALGLATATAPAPARTPAPMATPIPPTNTPPPPATEEPTFTASPTDTSVPASRTPLPTHTPVPPTPTRRPTPEPTAIPASNTRTRSQDGMVMVYVPAGKFLMGSLYADVQAGSNNPPHWPYLDAFWIDKTEVTNAEYRQCVEAGACPQPCTDSTFNKDNQPVACVTWDDAKAYCEWAGARLPTEAEWEKAARGTDGRDYPWGNEAPDCNRARYDKCGWATAVVGSKPAGASPYGAMDMAGNVSEWAADWYSKDYYAASPARNPQGPDSGQYRVTRGGYWGGDPALLRSAERGGGNPDQYNFTTGFRCALSATSSPQF